MNYFILHYADGQVQIYDAVLYCKFLMLNIRLAFCHYLDENQKVVCYKLHFSADLNLPAFMIEKYYQASFQQEFLIRDSKQFTGLQGCQARSTAKLEYPWNTSLTAINIAKAEHLLTKPKAEMGSSSMSSIKTLYQNQLLIERFFDILSQNTKLRKNYLQNREHYHFGAIAAKYLRNYCYYYYEF